tara:strand:- start:67 stop:270 length:204 start_codon:yes stop_codon:yes gene_type:complete
MAVSITIEFTDAQWALIEKNYTMRDMNLDSDDKPAELAAYLKSQVERNVLKYLQREAAAAQNNAFNV